MGLAGTKRRTKLSADPNNTAWSKATDGFGHKILSAQGWKPGQLLGAVDANHAEHFTAANASHIRVVLREDNLGLGAQLGKSNADTFGLSTLSGIFGRLNGKSDAELAKQESVQRDLELRSYQTRKYGSMNFVRGGVLLGDKIEDLIDDDTKEVDTTSKASRSQSSAEPTTKQRKTKSSKRRRYDLEQTLPQTADEDEETFINTAQSGNQEDLTILNNTQYSEKELKAMLKAEKRERKEAKRKRKAARSDLAQDNQTAEPSPLSTPTGTSTGTSTPSFQGSRHNVRQRFIQQKRMASMDARALDEILMRKTPIC